MASTKGREAEIARERAAARLEGVKLGLEAAARMRESEHYGECWNASPDVGLTGDGDIVPIKPNRDTCSCGACDAADRIRALSPERVAEEGVK